IIMIFMCWGLLRALRIETAKTASRTARRIGAPGNLDAESWQRRLKLLIAQPKKSETLEFLDDVVEPALQQVRQELERQKWQCRVERGDDGRCWIEVGHGEEIDFFYSARPVPYEAPAFSLRDTRKQRMEELKFYRPE